jgi:hypothetical protein
MRGRHTKNTHSNKIYSLEWEGDILRILTPTRITTREIWGSIQFMECDKIKCGRGGRENKNISQKLSMKS